MIRKLAIAVLLVANVVVSASVFAQAATPESAGGGSAAEGKLIKTNAGTDDVSNGAKAADADKAANAADTASKKTSHTPKTASSGQSGG